MNSEQNIAFWKMELFLPSGDKVGRHLSVVLGLMIEICSLHWLVLTRNRPIIKSCMFIQH